MAWKDKSSEGRGRSSDGSRNSKRGEGKRDSNFKDKKRSFSEKAGSDKREVKEGDKKWEKKPGDRPYQKTYTRPGESRPKHTKVKLTAKSGVPEEDGMMRLNKYIANAGICSRREADTLITSGVISVNGKVVTELGTRVKKTDRVKYEDQTLKHEKLVYLILNKPKDFITTMDDPMKRKTVLDLVGKACKERIFPVGRLDRNTTGVLLLSNDGDLAKKLMHPKHLVKKIYQVDLDKALKQEDLDKITAGLELEDGFIKPDEVAYSSKDNKREVGIEIHSGKNRIVRRIFESLGYKVLRLDRVYFAGLTKKGLSRGQYRFLEEDEVRYLKMLG